MERKFEIIGVPMGKQRPRFSKKGKFVSVVTPDKTVNYETWALSCYMEEFGHFDKMEGPLDISIRSYYPIPKKYQKPKYMELILAEKLFPLVKPDVDNVSKIILDALNKYAYDDDKQAIDLHTSKRYGVIPRVVVTIRTVEVD